MNKDQKNNYTGTLKTSQNGPRIVAWEITRRCPLACRHCRAGAQDHEYSGELTTDESLKVLNSLARYTRPMIIWTGGEPMYRPDIIELVRGATERGIRSVMAPCGTMVNKESLSALKAAGVTACSFSVDGATAQSHDAFRGVVGAFDNIIRAMRVAADIGMPFQINTTVSKLNLDELPAVRELAMQLGAIMHDLFFLVPVGRGKGVGELALSAGQTEKALRWMFEMNQQGPIAMRETCAPQAVRIWDNLGRPGKKPSGCMGGKGFVFISHRGTMQPCGFLDVDSGNLRDFDFDFASAYRNSKVFSDLQRCDNFADGCGDCSFNYDCSGCRARAYAVAGDYMAADPSCPIANAKHKR